VEKHTPAQLEERAYHIWERAGRPHGQALEHWLQAQAEVITNAPAEKPKRRTRKAASSTAKTTNGKAKTTRAKAAGSKAEPAKAKPKKVAKSESSTQKTGSGRKRTAPRA
jgi:hypothetical protein